MVAYLPVFGLVLVSIITPKSSVVVINVVELRVENVVVTDMGAVSIALRISDVSGLGITSISFEVYYDPEVIQLQFISNGLILPSSWNDPIVSQNGVTTQVFLFGTRPLGGAGVIAIFHFEIVGGAGTFSPIEISKIILNEGVPAAFGIGGKVTINRSPEPFSLLAPSDGSEVTFSPVRLTWQSSEDSPGDTLSYVIFMSESLSTLDEDTLSVTTDLYYDTELKNNSTTYYWKVIAVDQHQSITMSEKYFSFVVNINTINTSDTTLFPRELSINEIYPNPSNTSTTIQFSLPKLSNVIIDIYDLLGRHFKRHTFVRLTAGHGNYLTIDTNKLVPGIYFFRLQTQTNSGETYRTGKFVVQR